MSDTSFILLCRKTDDPGDRLSSWSRPNNPANLRQDQDWAYDMAGNWNSTTIDTVTQNRNHDSNNQLTSIAGNATTNDARGNLTHYKVDLVEYDLTYDLDNRISEVDNGTDTVEYRYDALGRRVLRKEGSTTTALIWWGDSELAEHKHTATKTVIENDLFSHPNQLNAIVARAVDGSKFKMEWYHKNYLDHVYAVSDDSGDLI